MLVACASDVAVTTQPATYVATLAGANERPRPLTTTATGNAVVTVTGSAATYRVTATGFGTPLLAGHIHIGADGTIGPVIVPFIIVAQSGTVATGTIDLATSVTQGNITITGDSLRALLNSGLTYVNLYTAAAPDGEIRGQLARQ